MGCVRHGTQLGVQPLDRGGGDAWLPDAAAACACRRRLDHREHIGRTPTEEIRVTQLGVIGDAGRA